MVYLGKSKIKDMFIGARSDLFKFARMMRLDPTESETILWSHLRKLRSEGVIFRRQHPVDIFIADFYCHKLKLVIEVDGEIHDQIENQEYDDGRSGELERYGITVIRFRNDEIESNPEQVLTRIRLIINDLASPSPPGEGDGRG